MQEKTFVLILKFILLGQYFKKYKHLKRREEIGISWKNHYSAILNIKCFSISLTIGLIILINMNTIIGK